MKTKEEKIKAVKKLFSEPEFKFTINQKPLETLIIQGGMGVDISTDKLAKAISKTGSAGTIATVATTHDYSKLEAEEGILGLNNLVKATDYEKNYALGKAQKLDYIISGAGTNRTVLKRWKGQLEKLNNPYHYYTIPIISSLEQLNGLIKRDVGIGILENTSAGGHNGLGLNFEDTLKRFKKERIDFKGNKIIWAGGIRTPDDIVKVLDLGFSAVQLGTQFFLAEETNIFKYYKNLIINSNEYDIGNIPSPTGLAASGFKNYGIMKKVLKGKKLIKTNCPKGKGCLDECDYIQISAENAGYGKDFDGNYCLRTSLRNLHIKGKEKESLYFSGKRPDKLFIKKIKPAKEIIEDYLEGIYDSIVERKTGLKKYIPFLVKN